MLNAGGVTVSYFEFLKNLSHVRFGRLSKRWEESSRGQLVDFVEQNVDSKLSDEERRNIVRGGDELDFVRSGLEDTMAKACRETLDTAKEFGVDYRKGALINAINKIAQVYEGSGSMFD